MMEPHHTHRQRGLLLHGKRHGTWITTGLVDNALVSRETYDRGILAP